MRKLAIKGVSIARLHNDWHCRVSDTKISRNVQNNKTCEKLPDWELNPGLARDRREY